MIPKSIHYCWFGGNPKPKLAEKCISSWKRYCNEFEIIEWNEDNFDIESAPLYVKQAYESKKWAFVTDYVRLYALVNYGGIYMDTDVEVIKPLDDILKYEAVSGFESETEVPTGLMGCIKNQPFFLELLREYDDISFIKEDGTLDVTSNVTRITNACLKYGLKQNNTFQTVHGFTLFPKEYFCPKDYGTGKIKKTKNTFTIHHFSGSWISKSDKLMLKESIRVVKHPYIYAYPKAFIRKIKRRISKK